MAGLVIKTLKDGDGVPFDAYFYDNDTALAPAAALYDYANNALLDPAASSPIKGLTANDAAVVDPPILAGGRAKTSLPTAVADADVVYALLDKYGRAIARGALRENVNPPQVTPITGTSETTVVTADASNKLDLNLLILANTNTTNPVTATLKDNTAGTTRAVFQIPAGCSDGFALPVDSGLPQAAINTTWTITLAGTSPTVTVTAGTVKAGA
jgi:hypothetical protein